jgi:hypothetical protein
MENKQKGILIVGLGLIMLLGGVLIVARYWNQIYLHSVPPQINQGPVQTSNANSIDVPDVKNVVSIENEGLEMKMPIMPSSNDLANKTPESLVKSFYAWYVAAENYSIYKIRQKMQGLSDEESIRVYELAKSSSFVSSNFVENIEKHMGMYDPVLCTNDPEHNVVREYNLKIVEENIAQVEVVKGYEGNDSTEKIFVLLRKEGPWKIDDIVCNIENKKE